MMQNHLKLQQFRQQIRGKFCFSLFWTVEHRSEGLGIVTNVIIPVYNVHLSHEKNPGWLGYIGDEILPSCIGIIINHYKDPY